jgi:hypothetical protein
MAILQSQSKEASEKAGVCQGFAQSCCEYSEPWNWYCFLEVSIMTH